MELKPSFLKKLDNYLLKNLPVTWSSRVVTFGIAGVGFAALIGLLSFIVPNDPRNSSMIHYWITLISILSLLGFIAWMIYLLRFNVFKRFGKWNNFDTIKTFFFYFTIILIIVSWSFIPPTVESARANSAYTSDELVKDINDMNIKICQLERDSLDIKFANDTLLVDKNASISTRNKIDYDTTGAAEYRDDYFIVDTAVLKTRLLTADSSLKLNDSMFVVYDCPDYIFISDYRLQEYTNNIFLKPMDIYHQVIANKSPVDVAKIKADLGKLFVKYSPEHNVSTLNVPSRNRIDYSEYSTNPGFHEKIAGKYDLYRINSAIGNIAEKKYRWDREMIAVSWRIAYYITLILSLLVLMYRHTTRKTFFLSVLAAVVLSIFTGLMVALASDENSFFIWSIIYFIAFAVIAGFIVNSQKRSVVTGISLNLLVFMSPFMPLIITAFYYQSLRQKYNYLDIPPIEYEKIFANEQYHLFLSEIGGILFLLLMLATLYQKGYKKWYSLPEE